MKTLLPFMILLKMFVSIRSVSPSLEDEESDRAQIEVKAQLMRCTGANSGDPDKFTSFIGFDKDEEFAKSEINACRNKLVVTMKIYNPKQTLSRDEYVTLDHIFDPITRSKAKLLNPYVIRVMQGTPFLTYDLHFSQIVNGEVTDEVIPRWNPDFPGCQKTVIAKPIDAANASVPNEHKAEIPSEEDVTEDSLTTPISHLVARSVTNLGPVCGSEQVMGKSFGTTFCCICVQSDDIAAKNDSNFSKGSFFIHNRQIQSYDEDNSQDNALSHEDYNKNDKPMKYDNYISHLNAENEFLNHPKVKIGKNKEKRRSSREFASENNQIDNYETNAVLENNLFDATKKIESINQDILKTNAELERVLQQARLRSISNDHLLNESKLKRKRKQSNEKLKTKSKKTQYSKENAANEDEFERNEEENSIPKKLIKQRKSKDKYFRNFLTDKEPHEGYFVEDTRNDKYSNSNLKQLFTNSEKTTFVENAAPNNEVKEKVIDQTHSNIINCHIKKNKNSKYCKKENFKEERNSKLMHVKDNKKEDDQLLRNYNKKIRAKSMSYDDEDVGKIHFLKKDTFRNSAVENDNMQSNDRDMNSLPEIDYFENYREKNVNLNNKEVYPSLLEQKIKIKENKKQDGENDVDYLFNDFNEEVNDLNNDPVYNRDYYNQEVGSLGIPVLKLNLAKSFPTGLHKKAKEIFPKTYQRKPRDLRTINSARLHRPPNDDILENNHLTTADKLRFIELADNNLKIPEYYLEKLNTLNENNNFNSNEKPLVTSSVLNYPLKNIHFPLPNVDTHTKFNNDLKEEELKKMIRRQVSPSVIDCSDNDVKNKTFVSKHLSSDQAHCMKFSEIWYTVYTLDPPVLVHEVGLQVFEKRSVSGAPDVWLMVTSFPVHIGPSKPRSTDEDSISFTYTFYPEIDSNADQLLRPSHPKIDPHHHRLLIPQPIPAAKAAKYPELVGGPEEYLILNDSLIGPECGRAGVAFEAFAKAMGLSNGRAQEIENCLANQPMQLWRQDKKAEQCHRPLKHFLKHFGVLPKEDAVKGSQASIVRDGPLSYALEGQIRADFNTVVRVGTSARITEAVVDGSCALNTVVSICVTNMGLASAVFNVRVSDCGPGLPYPWGHLEANSSVISPQKSRSFTIRMPGPPESYKNAFYCSVEVLNAHRELLAMRRIRVEPLSRCLCVWHCLCACISSAAIPRAYALRCNEMSSEHQHAAGFQGSPPDVMYVVSSCLLLDILIFTGAALLILLLMGFTKGLIGLVWSPMVGNWSIDAYGKPKNSLEKYYENDLKHRPVITDSQGFPIHPDTGKRTVRTHKQCTQFLLNLIFFIAFPFIILCKVCKYLWCCKNIRTRNKGTGDTTIDEDSDWNKPSTETKWQDGKNDDEMQHLLGDAEDRGYSLCDPDCGNRGRCWMTGGPCGRSHSRLRAGQITPVSSYNGTYEEDLVERQIIAQLKRSQETLLEHGMEIRTAGSHTKISPFQEVDHNELNRAQSLIARMLQARVVFRHCTGSKGNALIPAGVSYCVRGYFLRGLVGITFITPTPLLQHWQLKESGRMEILSPPRVLSSSDFTVEYDGALQVLRSGELSLQPNAPCINVRLQDLTT